MQIEWFHGKRQKGFDGSYEVVKNVFCNWILLERALIEFSSGRV